VFLEHLNKVRFHQVRSEHPQHGGAMCGPHLHKLIRVKKYPFPCVIPFVIPCIGPAIPARCGRFGRFGRVGTGTGPIGNGGSADQSTGVC